MNLLLKALLIRRDRDDGFILPIAIALGLIMTLVGLISIFQSSDEKTLAVSQRSSSRALAAAEAGVASYRELIDNYKNIAFYEACDGAWSGANCPDTGATVSWARATNIPDIAASCPIDGDTAVAAATTRAWQNIGADASQGQFRLWDYTYDPGIFNSGNNSYDGITPGGANARQPTGTLIVEGRVNQNNTNFANDIGASVARISLDLPLQPGIPDPNDPNRVSIDDELNGLDPALWIVEANETSGVTDVGNLRVNGNIILTNDAGDCDFDSSASLPAVANLFDSTNQSIIISPIAPQLKPVTGNNRNIVTSSSDLTGPALPRPGDTWDNNVQGDTVFYYELSGDLNLNPGERIDVRSGRKVVIYVDGNININSSPGTTGEVEMNYDYDPATDSFTNDSSHLEVYVLDDPLNPRSINITGDGEVKIQALIHAPEATLNIPNIGSTDPNVTMIGALWVKNWNIAATLSEPFDINIYDDSAGNDVPKVEAEYFNYTYVYDFLKPLNVQIAKPKIDAPSRWETQQAN